MRQTNVCNLFAAAGQMFALSLRNAQVFHWTISYVGVCGQDWDDLSYIGCEIDKILGKVIRLG